MKINITEYFIKRPIIFWSLMISILIAGLLSFIQMPKLEDPAVAVKQAMVVVRYPGASAHEVELEAVQIIEDNLRTLPDVKKIKSECFNGQALIAVEFEMTVLLEDIEQHFDLLRRKMSDVTLLLPQGCYEPIVIDDMMDVYGIFYSLEGKGYSMSELESYAKYIQREILAIKGVKRVNIAGKRDEVINIILSKEKIARNGLIPTQIMLSLQNAGKMIDGGYWTNNNSMIQLQVGGVVKTEEDIENLLINTTSGAQVRIGDIATVKKEYAEPQRNGFFVNGEQALAICVALESNVIVPDVGKAVDERMNEIMERLPIGIKTDKIFFQPEKVDDAINSFMVNLLISVLIVIVVLVFTMGFKSGVIIGFGLVLTIALSFPILLMCGTTLQRISLGAFIVAMGMLVDNAIVIMDGILIDKKRGLGPKTYLYRIGKNTALPLLGATIIAVSTFLCIYLSPDSAGEYAGDLFLVLCVSLLVSWTLALTQVPMCAKSWLSPRADKSSNGETHNSPIHTFVRKSISKLITHKRATIVAAVVILALSMLGMTKVKNLFFPDFDYKQFVVEYFLPGEASPTVVRADLLKMSNMLLKNKEVERVAASMGSAPAHYCLVRPMTSGGDCYGELMVDCKDYKTVEEQIPIIRQQLREAFPDGYIRIRKYNFSIASSHTVEVEFTGPDPAILRDLSSKAEAIMRDSKYIDSYSVQNNWKSKSKTVVAKYVKSNGLSAGIERSDVANALKAATDGMPIGVINNNDKMTIINLLVRNEDGSLIKDLNNIPVWSTINMHLSGQDVQNALTGGGSLDQMQDKMFRSVPLRGVVDELKLEWQEGYVARLNGQRAIEAECDPDANNDKATPAKVTADIKDKIESIELPDGYNMRWVGEGELQTEAIGNLIKYVPITIFLILFILLLLFNSWRKVILIILCFPFVFCGITPLLLISNQPFTFMAIIGMMGLIGMMVKNAIVLVDEINRLQVEEKYHPYNAVVEATVSRVRPVVMASLTTIVGMVPLLGDPMYGSMAITIMGGLTMGTIITLILLPLFYTAIFRISKPKN